jgi:hypothetical protein
MPRKGTGPTKISDDIRFIVSISTMPLAEAQKMIATAKQVLAVRQGQAGAAKAKASASTASTATEGTAATEGAPKVDKRRGPRKKATEGAAATVAQGPQAIETAGTQPLPEMGDEGVGEDVHELTPA